MVGRQLRGRESQGAGALERPPGTAVTQHVMGPVSLHVQRKCRPQVSRFSASHLRAPAQYGSCSVSGLEDKYLEGLACIPEPSTVMDIQWALEKR